MTLSTPLERMWSRRCGILRFAVESLSLPTTLPFSPSMIHISGEKSKRGEIRFPKMGMAIFILRILKSKRNAREGGNSESGVMSIDYGISERWESGSVIEVCVSYMIHMKHYVS